MENISNKIFDRFGKERLSFEDLYIATLLVFNDINKYLPGQHVDPPKKDRVKEVMEMCDKNQNYAIDREEFLEFVKQLTSESFISVSQRLIITLVVAPTLAVVTKKSTEGVPGLGKMVQKVPSSAYALLVTLAALLFQNSRQQLLK